MKHLHITNTCLIGINVLLYFAIFPGMLFQIVLGIVQVIMAIIIAFHLKELTLKTRNLFYIYSIVTMIMLSLYAYHYIADIRNHGNYYLAIYFIIPICLAFLHLYITYLINRNLEHES